MIPEVDQIHCALRLLVLLILVHKDILYVFQLALHLRRVPLCLIGVQDSCAPEIGQGAHIEDLKAVPSGKRHIQREKAQVADRENDYCRKEYACGFPSGDCQVLVLQIEVPVDLPEQEKEQSEDCKEKRCRPQKAFRRKHFIYVAVDLPFGGRG